LRWNVGHDGRKYKRPSKGEEMMSLRQPVIVVMPLNTLLKSVRFQLQVKLRAAGLLTYVTA
jgi:hypothetical protein